MNIGYVNPMYAVVRNILNGDASSHYVRIRSYEGLMDKVLGRTRLGRFCLKDAGFAHFGGFARERIDLLHFFNRIPVWPCRKRYVTTFEDVLPRYMGDGWLFRLGIESLMSDQCKCLIAFSECANDHQIRYDRQLGISELDRKIKILLPPQKVLVSEAELQAKEIVGPLKFIFVGKAFFRKGGMNICRALKRVRREMPVEITIIGNVDYFDYAFSHRVDDVNEAHRFIEENKTWVHYYSYVPNGEVLQLMENSHIGLLPTRDDSFGYSVLEMQAAGLPCITTDIWSLPEVNNDDCGWMIPLEKNELRQANYFTDEGLREIDAKIENGIVAACEKIASDIGVIREKGVRTLKRIREKHDPYQFGRRLHGIYEEALA